MSAPRLRLPRRRLLSLAGSVARRERRSFAADCVAMVASFPLLPEVYGLEHLPKSGPVCVVANHYQRSDLWIGWAGALLSHAVSQVRDGDPPLHLLVVAGWPVTIRGRTHALPGSRWVFGRVAHAWSMVPIPLNSEDAPGRARALRELAALAISGRAVALFPEGESGRAGEPGIQLPGVGRWLRILARQRVTIVPAAVVEARGTLCAAFGAPLDPKATADPMPAIRALYHGLLTRPESEVRR